MFAIDLNKRDRELRERVIEARLKDFIKRWAPSAAFENAEFCADITMLVHTIHSEANEAQYAQLKAITEL